MNPIDPVDGQFEAYNAHHLERFLAHFSEDVQVYRMPASEPATEGKAALGAFYAKERFTLPALRAEVLQRMVVGNRVIDHERITGLHAAPFEAVVIYEVRDGLICTMWMFLA
jgi:hypothetical protein